MTVAATHYQVLGVAPDASAEQIRRAFRALARRHHPDVSREPGAEARFREVQRAHEVLSDAQARARYDAELARLRGPEASGRTGGGGPAHFHWENIAAPKGPGRGTGAGSRAGTGLDELYDAFFGTRAGAGLGA